MQRLYIYVILALVLIVFYYYKPLRNIIAPEEKAARGTIPDQKASDKESPFDELGMELYAVANKMTHLQGKVQLLEMAQKNRDWFKEEEYAQLPALLAKAEEDLKEAETKYEQIKNKYARETVTKMIKESLDTEETKRIDSLGEETLP